MILLMMNSLPMSSIIVSTFRTIFSISIVGSAIAGSLFSEKIERSSLLYLWMILGMASSFLLVFIYEITIGHLSMIFLLLGISFGLGISSCLAYLADYTNIENRGHVSAIIFFTVNLAALPIAILFMSFSLTINSMILAIWRGLGLLIFVLLKPPKKSSIERKKTISLLSAFHDRSLVLYFIPWLMFSLIDIIEKAVLESFFGPEFQLLILTIAPIIASFSIFAGGLLSDRIGRKRVVMYGFISLGIGYAIIGVAPGMIIARYFYLVIDSVAAGILWVTFLLILWGDLSHAGAREKYYAIGISPFFLRQIVPLFIVPLIGSVQANAAFSVASFFLFLTVLPLMYAPETLPEKKIRIRQLRGYVEKAKKFREKYFKKS